MEAVETVDEDVLHNKTNIQNQLSHILSIMNEIRTMRENTSIQEQIDIKTDDLQKELSILIEFMEGQ